MNRHRKKEIKTKLLFELLKDSGRTDRELAKVLGVSQPTISRMKRRLVEDEMIQSYSIIPNFYKMGYRIMAQSFVKTNSIFSSDEGWIEMINEVKTWMMNRPNVIYCDTCRGMDMDGGFISIHKSYEDFDKFISKHNRELGRYIIDVKSVLFTLGKREIIKPFNFKYLAQNI